MQILDILSHCIPHIEENKEIMSDKKYDLCYTVENINALVKAGTPFRDAYHAIKNQVNDGKFIPIKNLDHTHSGSIGNLNLERIMAKFSNS